MSTSPDKESKVVESLEGDTADFGKKVLETHTESENTAIIDTARGEYSPGSRLRQSVRLPMSTPTTC